MTNTSLGLAPNLLLIFAIATPLLTTQLTWAQQSSNGTQGVEVTTHEAEASDIATSPQNGNTTEEAADQRPELNIEFRATADCPNKADFVRALVARLPRETSANDATDQLQLMVSIERSGAQFVGIYRQSRPGSLSEERRIEGTSCQEVIDALSVVAAVSLKPMVDEQVEPHEEEVDNLAVSTHPDAAEDDPAKEQVSVSKAPAARLPRFSLDAQAGATFGTLPKMPVPRLDFAVGYAAWVSPKKSWGTNLAVIARARFNYLFHTKSLNLKEITVDGVTGPLGYELSGFSITAGGCFAPFFNPHGASLAGCLDAGVSLLNMVSVVPDAAYVYPLVGVRLGASVEGSYVLDELFHLVARIGYEGNVMDDRSGVVPDGIYHNRHAAYVTVGVGVHF